MMKFLYAGLFFFVTALSVSAPAQTTVCSGDSVVLVLNGYKQGSTVWQQSSDQTTWDTAQGTPYKDSLIITASITLFYRAIVTDSTCSSPFYSDTVMVVVRPVPPPPVAKPASNVTLLSFDANWSASAGATKYYLDVAPNSGFTSFVPGYEKLKVNNKTTYSVTGISCDTTYYYRVRVYDDSCGTVNSNTISVTTPVCPVYCTYKSTCNGNITDNRDNKIYKTVQIGTQCWMAQNLNVGTAILGEVQQSQATGIEKYCYGYGAASDINDSSQCATYGGLYMWDEMMAYGQSVGGNGKGPQGICPAGWHLPTDNEWKCLEMNVGMSKNEADNYSYPGITPERGTNEGGKLKDTSSLWNSPNAGATNSSRFTALPGGFRPDNTRFSGKGAYADFWTATEYDAPPLAWARELYTGDPMAIRSYQFKNTFGCSVRCVKD